MFGFGRAMDKPVRNYSNGEYLFNFGRSTSGKSVNEMTAMQTRAVYACVRILSEAVASLPIHVYRYKDGEKEMVCDHPLYTLLHDEPNPEMTSLVFRETLMSHLLIWGNAYAQIIRNGKGEVLSLYPLLPNKMSVERDSNGVLYYVYSRYTDENPNMKKMGDIILRQEDVLPDVEEISTRSEDISMDYDFFHSHEMLFGIVFMLLQYFGARPKITLYDGEINKVTQIGA